MQTLFLFQDLLICSHNLDLIFCCYLIPSHLSSFHSHWLSLQKKYYIFLEVTFFFSSSIFCSAILSWTWSYVAHANWSLGLY
jgi:hypothetical protein